MRVLKHAAAVIVHKALGQRAFREDDAMRLELDVEVIDALDALGLDDRDAIDEIDGLDQHAFKEHRVVWRDPQIAARLMHIERARLDADRQNVRRTRRSVRNSCAARSI